LSTIKTSNIRPASPIKPVNLSDRRQVITPSIVGETYRLNFDESSDSYSSENDSYPESYSESLSDDEEFDAESSGEV